MENKPIIQQIYEHYLKGNRLTTIDALNLFRTTELRSLNCKIKNKYGCDISWEWITNEKTGKQYKQFFIKGLSINLNQ